jgi:hypothetical protein
MSGHHRRPLHGEGRLYWTKKEHHLLPDACEGGTLLPAIGRPSEGILKGRNSEDAVNFVTRQRLLSQCDEKFP